MKIRHITFAICISILVSSCSKPDSTAASAQEGASEPPNLIQKKQKTEILNFALGSFVDPSTYAIGGQGSEFSQNDNLYGVVDFNSVSPGDQVGMRIVNINGATEAESIRTLEGPDQRSINFDFGIPTRKKLPSGIYKVEVTINQASTLQSEITIR